MSPSSIVYACAFAVLMVLSLSGCSSSGSDSSGGGGGGSTPPGNTSIFVGTIDAGATRGICFVNNSGYPLARLHIYPMTVTPAPTVLPADKNVLAGTPLPNGGAIVVAVPNGSWYAGLETADESFGFSFFTLVVQDAVVVVTIDSVASSG